MQTLHKINTLQEFFRLGILKKGIFVQKYNNEFIDLFVVTRKHCPPIPSTVAWQLPSLGHDISPLPTLKGDTMKQGAIFYPKCNQLNAVRGKRFGLSGEWVRYKRRVTHRPFPECGRGQQNIFLLRAMKNRIVFWANNLKWVYILT